MSKKENCPDCGVSAGDFHSINCDVERCLTCGGQRLSCDCNSTNRQKWSGEWPFLDVCRELNLWCQMGSRGWEPCTKETPGAVEDLNALSEKYKWDSKIQKWVKRIKGKGGCHE